jgi:hypothetical protein
VTWALTRVIQGEPLQRVLKRLLALSRQGGRKLNPQRLPFQTLLVWLAPVTKHTLGIHEVTFAECSP